jgi:hypothetical protein
MMGSRYHQVYDGWKRDPEGFWAEAAAGTFWRVISEHGVVASFAAPTAFRAIKGQPLSFWTTAFARARYSKKVFFPLSREQSHALA